MREEYQDSLSLQEEGEEAEEGEFQVIWQKTWQIGDVGETVRTGAAKTAYAMKNAKAYTALKWDIMDLQTRRRRKLLQVGKLVYATYSGRPTDSDLLQKALEQADGIIRELRQKEAELARLCGVRFCPGCGGSEAVSHIYCSRCGRKLLEE